MSYDLPPRSIVGAALVAAALMLTSGCTSTDNTGAPAPSATAPAPKVSASAPSDAAPTGNDAQICKTAGKASADLVSRTLVGVGSGDSAGMGKAYRTGLTQFSGTLKAQAAQAGDAKLRAALQEVAAAAQTLAAAPDPMTADNKAFTQAGEKLGKLCDPADAKERAKTVVDGAVGPVGSACELPVTFSVAKSWKPKAVKVEKDAVLGDLVRKGPLSVVCEVDAKPAGHIGFIRVWGGAGAKASPLKTLQAFVKTEKPRKTAYTAITVGGRPGAEAVYDKYSEFTEEIRTERAFAVQTPRGAIVVTLGGFDAEEHTAMLPAYELAKSSLRVSP